MGMEHIARVYTLRPDQVTLDERLVLFVLAESTADDRFSFPHQRGEIARRCGFLGAAPTRRLYDRLAALENAGFISQKRERTAVGSFTGRVEVILTIESGTQTKRAIKATERSRLASPQPNGSPVADGEEPPIGWGDVTPIGWGLASEYPRLPDKTRGLPELASHEIQISEDERRRQLEALKTAEETEAGS